MGKRVLASPPCTAPKNTLHCNPRPWVTYCFNNPGLKVIRLDKPYKSTIMGFNFDQTKQCTAN